MNQNKYFSIVCNTQNNIVSNTNLQLTKSILMIIHVYILLHFVMSNVYINPKFSSHFLLLSSNFHFISGLSLPILGPSFNLWYPGLSFKKRLISTRFIFYSWSPIAKNSTVMRAWWGADGWPEKTCVGLWCQSTASMGSHRRSDEARVLHLHSTFYIGAFFNLLYAHDQINTDAFLSLSLISTRDLLLCLHLECYPLMYAHWCISTYTKY